MSKEEVPPAEMKDSAGDLLDYKNNVTVTY